MSGDSPIDSLSTLAAVSDADAAALFGAAGREDLLDGVLRMPLGRGRPTRSNRRTLVVAFAAVAIVAVASAATWLILRAPAHETTSVECVIKGVDTIVPAVSGDPAADCAATWEREEGTPAPPLVAYDNTFGGVTVLPRSETAPAGYRRLVSGQDVALIELQDSLDDYINGLNSRCLDSKSATALADSKLAQFGFTGWTVSVRSESYTANCVAGEYVDPSTQTVQLIPLEIPAAPQTDVQKLAAALRPLTQQCESLPAAVASVRAAASRLGMEESATTYQLNQVTDNTLRCASVYETVGGTIFLTVRGPNR